MKNLSEEVQKLLTVNNSQTNISQNLKDLLRFCYYVYNKLRTWGNHIIIIQKKLIVIIIYTVYP